MDDRALARRILRQTPAVRPALAAIGAGALLTAGLAVAQASLLADVVMRAFLGHDGVRALTTPLVALAAVIAARALVDAGVGYAGRRGALTLMSQLRGRLATTLLRRRPGLEGGARSGELTTAAVQGVDGLEAWFARYVPQVALAAVVPPVVLVYAATRDLPAAAVLAVTVPILIVFMVFVGLGARSQAAARWRALSVLGAHFADVVRELDVLRAHARERAQAERVGEIAERYRATTMSTLRVAFLSAFVLELVAMIGTALVAATIGLQLAAGSLRLADGLAVLLLCPELYAPLRGVGQQFHASADGLAGAERVLAVIDAPDAVTDAGVLPAANPATAAIVLDEVSVVHGDRTVLHDVSLTLEPGETVALVGPSGAGKSTLAALVLRLADPARGRVSCGGVDLRDVDLDDWRRRVAWVPQRPVVLAATLAHNVRLGRPGASDRAVLVALVQAGLGELVSRLPDGIRTVVGDGGRRLSAGEAQRVGLARALISDSPLLVLDEPTAHLDAETAASVERRLLAACRGRTTLLIAHAPQLAAQADRIVALRDGRLVPDAGVLELVG